MYYVWALLVRNFTMELNNSAANSLKEIPFQRDKICEVLSNLTYYNDLKEVMQR